MMKHAWIYLTMVFLLAGSNAIGAESIAFDQQVIFVGSFSNMRFTEEHQYGDKIELWRAGNRIFGHFLHSAGLAGDTPIGLLENVKYDPKSGKLSFKAKLTIGQHYCKVHTDVPSHDIFEFKGNLRKDTITGQLIQMEALDNDQVISDEKVSLPKGKQAPASAVQTYGEWLKQSKSILDLRGPKWRSAR
jgi:hypothetical protein